MLKIWWRQAPVTVALCVLMVLFYVATVAQSLSVVDNLSGSSLADRFILYLPAMSGPFGPLRAVGSAFMHLGPGHLVLNLLLLFLLGREVETSYGARMYLLLWFASAVGASTVTVWMDPLAAVVGASGVAYALMVLFAFLVAQRGGDLRAPIVLILANVAYTLMTPAVSLWGHMGGLLAGLLLALALLTRDRRVRWILVSGIAALFVIALLFKVATFTTSGFWPALL